MYFDDSQRLEEEEYEDDDAGAEDEHCDPSYSSTIPQSLCANGHRSSLSLPTDQGGVICLLCLANLISNPLSPTVHVSYALSQLSLALSQPPFLRSFLTFHSHFLVSPLVSALFTFNDDPIARQLIDLIVRICDSNAGNGDGVVCADFIARVSDRLSSGVLTWSRQQVYSLHCLGVLLNCQIKNPYEQIMNIDKLVSNLVAGLQLPSEEIRGEILFVLYKIFSIYSTYGDGNEILYTFFPRILHLSLEALLKTQSDDVRLNGVVTRSNCILSAQGDEKIIPAISSLFYELIRNNAYVSVSINRSGSMTFEATLTKHIFLYQHRGFLGDAFANDVTLTDDRNDDSHLIVLFSEAIKGPLLSSDRKVQICTLDLLVQYLSFESTSIQQIQVLVEENIADYIFEITRLSDKNDAVIKSCILILDLLSKAEESFNHRLAIGFATLIPVARHIAEVPFHPVQAHTLKLILKCMSGCPGMVSTNHIQELILVLLELLKKHADGEMDMLSVDTFIIICSIFVAIIKLPSCHGVSNLVSSVQEVVKYAILPCLHVYERHSTQLLHSLYMLKEVYAYSQEMTSAKDLSNNEFRNCILNVCKVHLLPWLLATINMIDEELVLGTLETFQSILILESDIMTIEFASSLASSSWFSFSFGCLGLFPSEKMKLTVYMIISSLADFILENKSGQSIRDSALFLPTDPVDLLFILSQKSSYNLKLSTCQSAVLLMLYTSSLHDDRITDEKLVLASLEQYILFSNMDCLCGSPYPFTVEGLVSVYGLYRTSIDMTGQSYNSEAEKILLQLVTESEWDLPSSIIHPASLKWLFQQEKIRKPLAYQILKFCKTNREKGIDTRFKKQCINTQTIARFVAAGDNNMAMLLVCLLEQLMEEGEEDDIISVLTLMAAIINICPTASDQLCLHGIGKALQSLYYDFNRSYSVQSFMATLVLVFSILCFTSYENLSDDEAWLAVIVKLLDCFIPNDAADGWTSVNLLVIAILCLILHHSTKDVLIEASKTILFNTSLISRINFTIQEATSKGPALVDDDERTNAGQTLTFVLLLTYFSFKSLHAVLPGIIDWQTFLNQPSETQLSTISITGHNLCRLMYFGSPLIKLVSSHCLLELFSRLSDQISKREEKLKCTENYLISVMAVLEGLALHDDSRVATNCALCLAMVFELYMPEAEAIKRNKWCRIIVEELAVTMAVPCLASSFSSYKPAVHIAVALLKVQNGFEWIKLLFNDACISSMIENVKVTNLNSEIVCLFRELFNSDLLNADHISRLSRVLQACRKRMYTDNGGDTEMDEQVEKVVIIVDDLEEACQYLLHLMPSESSLDMDSRESDNGRKKLLEEIECFLRSLQQMEVHNF